MPPLPFQNPVMTKAGQNIRHLFSRCPIEDLNNEKFQLCIRQNQAPGLNLHGQKEYESLPGNFRSTKPSLLLQNSLLKDLRNIRVYQPGTIQYVASSH